jgi:hypothetical protein
VKRLCVFYRLADRFLGNKKIEWIVCKECQRLLIRGETPQFVWQKVHKMNAVTDCSACDGDDLCSYHADKQAAMKQRIRREKWLNGSRAKHSFRIEGCFCRMQTVLV